MTLVEIFSIIFIHFVADFICQDEEWALGKSKRFEPLITHTVVYSAVWLWIGLAFMFNGIFKPLDVAAFTFITLVSHTITDYFTSRLVAEKFAKKELGSTVPNFGAFTYIGGDQVLHMFQLFATYYFLMK